MFYSGGSPLRKFVIIALLIAIAVPSGFARRKKPKAGKLENNTYTDVGYGFKITLPEGWKVKVGYAKDHFRLSLVQKKYEIPPDYLNTPDYTQVPKIIVWADTTTMGATAFVDSLVSPTFKSEQKKNIYKEFELLNEALVSSRTYRDPLVQKKRRMIEVDGSRGVLWAGRATYLKEVALSASATGGGKRVRGAYGGNVIALKKDNRIVVFHMMCEWNYFDDIEEILINMVKGLTWTDTGQEGKKDKG